VLEKNKKNKILVLGMKKGIKYIFAYDPKIKKRVTYTVEKGIATSLVSGNQFKYKPRKRKR